MKDFSKSCPVYIHLQSKCPGPDSDILDLVSPGPMLQLSSTRPACRAWKRDIWEIILKTFHFFWKCSIKRIFSWSVQQSQDVQGSSSSSYGSYGGGYGLDPGSCFSLDICPDLILAAIAVAAAIAAFVLYQTITMAGRRRRKRGVEVDEDDDESGHLLSDLLWLGIIFTLILLTVFTTIIAWKVVLVLPVQCIKCQLSCSTWIFL